MSLKELSLDNICDGEVPHLFRGLLEQVVANIADPNTNPEAVREISLKFRFKPFKDRSGAEVTVAPTMKPAAIKATGGMMHLRSVEGRMVATARDTRQQELPLGSVKTTAQAEDQKVAGRIAPGA